MSGLETFCNLDDFLLFEQPVVSVQPAGIGRILVVTKLFESPEYLHARVFAVSRTAWGSLDVAPATDLSPYEVPLCIFWMNKTLYVWSPREAQAKRLPLANTDPIIAATVLSNGLIAVARWDSPAWTVFDVYDEHGRVHSNQCYLHRPEYVELASAAHGFLAVHGHCTYELHIWRVTKLECVEVCVIDTFRIYSMAATFQGDIIIAGHYIALFTIELDGTAHKVWEADNPNVIDLIVPLPAYKFKTLDRGRAHSGVARLWDSLSPSNTISSRTDVTINNDWTVLPLLPTDAIAFSSAQRNMLYHMPLPSMLQLDPVLARARKYARILAQARRVEPSPFRALPFELCLHIVRLCSGEHEHFTRVATDHFGRPTLM